MMKGDKMTRKNDPTIRLVVVSEKVGKGPAVAGLRE